MILTQQDSEKNLLRFVAQAVEFLGPFKDVRHLRGGPLVGRHGRFGYLVVGAKEEPAAGDRFVLHVLAQQAG